jgi:glutamine synthetase
MGSTIEGEGVGMRNFELLARAVAAGEAHTVRVCFADHYGILRGRRIAAELFAADPCRQGFCDGALVWDIRCDIFEGTDFSNYRTGYPDLFVDPEMTTLRPCGWVPGEWAVLGNCRDAEGHQLPVDPRGILGSVAARSELGQVVMSLELHVAQPPEQDDVDALNLLEAGLRSALLGFDLPAGLIRRSPAEGSLTVTVPPLEPVAAADTVVLVRGAARELAALHGVEMTAMSRLGPGDRMTRMAVDLVELGLDQVREGLDRSEELSLLLRPLPGADGGVAGAGASVEKRPEEAMDRSVVRAASDANPYLVVAAALSAVSEVGATGPGTSESANGGYAGSIHRLAASDWASRWFSRLFLHDAIALARREAGICASEGGPWDRSRYWECG